MPTGLLAPGRVMDFHALRHTRGSWLAATGRIAAQRRANARFLEPEKSLSTFRTAIQSSQRSAALVGQSLSGKSRLRRPPWIIAKPNARDSPKTARA